MFEEYAALIAKVEDFLGKVARRRAEDLTCKAGCAACCEAWLTVAPVEAAYVRAGIAKLDVAARRELAMRGQRERERQATGRKPARCAMLDQNGRCSIYAHRPLVCRTQGHALRYPPGFVAVDSVRLRAAAGDVVHCPLNYGQAEPKPEDVLDAERVDQILAVVSRRFADAHNLDAEAREDLTHLAIDAPMLV